MTAPLPFSQNVDTIVSTMNAVLSALSGVPAQLARQESQNVYYPQVGAGEITDATSTHLATGTNALADVTWDFLSICGIGWDEWRKSYDPNVRIADDTYSGPGSPLGGIIYESTGNRTITVEVKVESFNSAGAYPVSEKIRTGLGLPTICNTFNDVGLAWREIKPSRRLDYNDENGRNVNVVLFEIVFNGFDSAKDDPVTTIQTVDTSGITIQS